MRDASELSSRHALASDRIAAATARSEPNRCVAMPGRSNTRTVQHPAWTFVEHRDGNTAFWTWTRLLLNGRAKTTSPRFANYGEAVFDAISNGFKPSDESWAVVTSNGTTHFNAERFAQKGTSTANEHLHSGQLPRRAQPPPRSNRPKRKDR